MALMGIRECERGMKIHNASEGEPESAPFMGCREDALWFQLHTDDAGEDRMDCKANSRILSQE
jgi:hypothetical protein